MRPRRAPAPQQPCSASPRELRGGQTCAVRWPPFAEGLQSRWPLRSAAALCSGTEHSMQWHDPLQLRGRRVCLQRPCRCQRRRGAAPVAGRPPLRGRALNHVRARAGQGGRRDRGAAAARLHGAHLRPLCGQAGGRHGQLPAQVHAVPVRGRGGRARAGRRVPPAPGRLPQDRRVPARRGAAERAAQPACRRCPGCAAEPGTSALRTSPLCMRLPGERLALSSATLASERRGHVPSRTVREADTSEGDGLWTAAGRGAGAAQQRGRLRRPAAPLATAAPGGAGAPRASIILYPFTLQVAQDVASALLHHFVRYHARLGFRVVQYSQVRCASGRRHRRSCLCLCRTLEVARVGPAAGAPCGVPAGPARLLGMGREQQHALRSGGPRHEAVRCKRREGCPAHSPRTWQASWRTSSCARVCAPASSSSCSGTTWASATGRRTCAAGSPSCTGAQPPYGSHGGLCLIALHSAACTRTPGVARRRDACSPCQT